MHQANSAGKVQSRAILLMLLMLTSLTIWIPNVSASDSDGDGYDDTVDDCDFAVGNSTVDRVGCPDSDGDGTSDYAQGTVSDFEGAEYRRTVSTSGSRGSMSRTIAVAPNGMVVAGADSGNVLLLLDAAGNEIKSLLSIDSDPRDLDFTPNGSLLAVSAYEADNNASVHVFTMDWVTQSTSLLVNLSANHEDDTFALRFSPSGDLLHVGGKDQNVTTYYVSNWTIAHIIETGDDIYNIKTSPDGSLVAFTHGEEMSVYHASDGTALYNVRDHSGYTLGLDWSPDGNWIVTGGSDNTVYVYHANNGTQVTNFSWSGDVNEIAFNRAGTHFVLATNDNDPTGIIRTSDWTTEATFGEFEGGSGSGASGRRGARTVAWSLDETKIYFGARYYGRIYTYYSPDAYAWMGGDITGELLESRFQEYADTHSDYVPMHYNSTVTQVTQNQCSSFNPMGAAAPLIGASASTAAEGLTTPLSNYSTSGMRDCDSTSVRLIEVPVARMPAGIIVGPGQEEQCINTIGGLTMAQVRWILSGASPSDLSTNGVHPGIVWNSVVPNDNGDNIAEWRDLHSSCPDEPIHVIHRWENRSVTQMISSFIFCDHCSFPEDWYAEGFGRLRLIEEVRGDIVTGVSNDYTFGVTELRVTLDSQTVYNVPMYDNWTHGATDAASGGGTLIHPSVENSSNGLWPFQDDYRLVIREDDLDKLRPFLTWMLSEEGQDNFDNIGFVRLDPLARVLAGDRIGIDLRNILPDDDGDGVWNGDDLCDLESGNTNTNPAEFATLDEFGCADSQRDSDGDGFMDDVDDCPEDSGTSVQPTAGCLDSDGDGWADSGDNFWQDGTQWSDQDGDGYGDNPTGFQPDSCPGESGQSTIDRYGCIDTDGDGYSDPDSTWTTEDGADEFKDDPTQWIDLDGDGVGDNYTWVDTDADGLSDIENGDAFPDDFSQSKDRDADGFGDSANGDAPDSCPNHWGNSTMEDSQGNQKLGCPDADGDGWADEDDQFPDEPTQYADLDGDGFGDSQLGVDADQCLSTPENQIEFVHTSGVNLGCAPSELDTDRDGVSDEADMCPNTDLNEAVNIQGCADYEWDSDDDGSYDDVDWAMNDPSQYVDADGDGYGDNSSAENGDQCPDSPSDIINQGLISTEDRIGCTDSDGDGWSDLGDILPNNPTQWADSDGDGYYDNWNNPLWTSDPMRDESWPGQFVPNARDPDRCPIHKYEFQNVENPGCPIAIDPSTALELDNSDDPGNKFQNSKSDEGGLGTVAIIAIAVGVILVIGLCAAAVIVLRKSNKPTKSRKKTTRPEESVEPEVPEASEESYDVESDPNYKVDEHGCEWWIDDDGAWWYRTPEMEDWAEYNG